MSREFSWLCQRFQLHWESHFPRLILIVLELGATLCSCFSFAMLEIVQALDSAFLLVRSHRGGVALHDAGRDGNEARLTLIVGFSIVVVV